MRCVIRTSYRRLSASQQELAKHGRTEKWNVRFDFRSLKILTQNIQNPRPKSAPPPFSPYAKMLILSGSCQRDVPNSLFLPQRPRRRQASTH
jgi:hypothetical protein